MRNTTNLPDQTFTPPLLFSTAKKKKRLLFSKFPEWQGGPLRFLHRAYYAANKSSLSLSFRAAAPEVLSMNGSWGKKREKSWVKKNCEKNSTTKYSGFDMFRNWIVITGNRKCVTTTASALRRKAGADWEDFFSLSLSLMGENEGKNVGGFWLKSRKGEWKIWNIWIHRGNKALPSPEQVVRTQASFIIKRKANLQEVAPLKCTHTHNT